uniref:hypothetical protein n=1 Tax=Saccharothrix mutabilis TaxID=33921 RepID=UPI0031D3C724
MRSGTNEDRPIGEPCHARCLIEVVVGDITRARADAIVTAADESPMGGRSARPARA